MLPISFLRWEAVEGAENGALVCLQHIQHQLLGCFRHEHLLLCCSELPCLAGNCLQRPVLC
jgi:hypothetical protein